MLSGVAAFAQTENARISGRVTDLTGAVIVGAQCEITNIETGVSVTTTTWLAPRHSSQQGTPGTPTTTPYRFISN
jgi:hypothetical protein